MKKRYEEDNDARYQRHLFNDDDPNLVRKATMKIDMNVYENNTEP